MFLYGTKKTVMFPILLSLLAVVATCPLSTAEMTVDFQTTPDQVLVLYNADWEEDATGSDPGQDSRELAEYYQMMHTDPVTGKKPFLLPLICAHGKNHLNEWFIKEKSNDNKNAIRYTGDGDPPTDFNWVLDSRHVEIVVPDKDTDWGSVTISIHSEAGDTSKIVYKNQEALEGLDVMISGPPKSHGFSSHYPPVTDGAGRTFRFDSTQLFSGTVTISLTAEDKEGRRIRDLSVRYYDRDEFVFSADGNDGIADDKHLSEDVLQPVMRFLEKPGTTGDGRLLKDQVLYIVAMHGLPFSAKGVFGAEHGATSSKSDHGSLTSLEQRLQSIHYPWSSNVRPPLTATYLSKGPQSESGVRSHIITTSMRYPMVGTHWNPYLHPDTYSYLRKGGGTLPSFYRVAPLAERRQHLTRKLHIFSATRIDGPSLEDAKRIIDNTLYANRYLRPEMDCSVRKRLEAAGQERITDIPGRMMAATEENLWGGKELQKIGFRSDAGMGLPFLVMPAGATEGKCGEKSNWKDTGFYPGGMHHKVISSNGLNFKKADVWQMLSQGITVTAAGSPAYRGGPHITNTTFWDNRIVMRYLLRGKDLGEALLLSNYHTNWSTSYIGDPLFRPDLRETVIDEITPKVSGDKISTTLEHNDETFSARFVAELEHDHQAPEVAAMRVACKDDNGVELNGHSSLFSRRPTVTIQGLTPENKYRCSVSFADPYENLTTLPAVNFTTPKITMSEKFIRGVTDFFKGIKVVPRR